jgi:hypothetical protein
LVKNGKNHLVKKRKNFSKKDFSKINTDAHFFPSFFVLKSIAFIIDKDHVSESMSFRRQACIQYYVDDEPIVS